MNTGRKLLREFIKKEIRSMNEDSNGSVKDFIDDALKKAGIKVTKYLPMKSGWLVGKFWWGGFYTVQANKRKDILPFTVDKKGNIHLNVSPEKYIVGKMGKMSQIVKNLKDFKQSDLDVYESVNERKLSSQQKKAILIAIEMSGNMTGATKKIEKIKKGLSNDKKVKDAIRLANESVNKTKLTAVRNFIRQEIRNVRQINEASVPHLQTPSDVSYYNRDWGAVFEAWANRHNVEFGPRESDMYDWNDRRLYDDVVKEYNAHMAKVAKKLNDAAKGLEDPYKVWNKILDKYRRKDRS